MRQSQPYGAKIPTFLFVSFVLGVSSVWNILLPLSSFRSQLKCYLLRNVTWLLNIKEYCVILSHWPLFISLLQEQFTHLILLLSNIHTIWLFLFQISKKRNSQLIMWFSLIEQIYIDCLLMWGTVLCKGFKREHHIRDHWFYGTYHFNGREKHQEKYQYKYQDDMSSPLLNLKEHRYLLNKPICL